MAKKKNKPQAPAPKANPPAPKANKIPPKPPGRQYLWSNKTWHPRPEGKRYRKTAPKFRTTTIDRAPAGSYDPMLDAERRKSGRGLGDLLDDVEREGTEATTDLILGQEDLGRQQGELDEDYGLNVTGVRRDYSNLATQQAGQQRTAGLYGGGAAEQARLKREGNQQLSLDDLLKQYTRGGEGITRAGGQLLTGFERARNVRENITVPRAQREDTQFGLDTEEAKMASYLQGGGSTTTKTKLPGVKLPKPKVWNRRMRRKLRV